MLPAFHSSPIGTSGAEAATDGGALEPEAALVLQLLLASAMEPRICNTATKSASLNRVARFFNRERRFSAFFKSLAIFFLASFMCFCSAFKRRIESTKLSDSIIGIVTRVWMAGAPVAGAMAADDEPGAPPAGVAVGSTLAAAPPSPPSPADMLLAMPLQRRPETLEQRSCAAVQAKAEQLACDMVVQ